MTTKIVVAAFALLATVQAALDLFAPAANSAAAPETHIGEPR